MKKVFYKTCTAMVWGLLSGAILAQAVLEQPNQPVSLVRYYLPKLAWQSNCCWFNTIVQLVDNMPLFVQSLLKNKHAFEQCPFLRDFAKFFEAIHENKEPEYAFCTEISEVHRKACSMVGVSYAQMFDARIFAALLFGQLPARYRLLPTQSFVSKQLEDLVECACDYSLKEQRVIATCRIDQILASKKISLKMAVQPFRGAPFLAVLCMQGDFTRGKPYTVPLYFSIPTARRMVTPELWPSGTGVGGAKYELIGICVHEAAPSGNRDAHCWCLLKNQYERRPAWYVADDARKRYEQIAEQEAYVQSWPKNEHGKSCQARLLIYKRIA